MSEIQRYACALDESGTAMDPAAFTRAKMVEAPLSGEYVRFTDHEAERAENLATIDFLNKELRSAVDALADAKARIEDLHYGDDNLLIGTGMREVTIKSVYGDVLYVAKGAADVRAAVEEAVRKGVDLRSANLRSADLRSANLGSANLRFADLGSADLGSANLRFADLGSADLGSANLRFANLRFANLGSADLGSANLGSADLGSANLGSADLRSADLRFADLRFANLRSADLRFADLRFANLRSADLRSANLGSANLGSADLRFAKGVSPERSNELLLLREQVGKIRAYKLVTHDLKSPIHSENPITYEIGSTVQAEADTNEARDCGAGINLATLPWCLNEHREGHRILVCEFTAKDIAAIPNADGKFRVHKAKVVKELDLTEMFEQEKKDRAEFEKAWAEREMVKP